MAPLEDDAVADEQVPDEQMTLQQLRNEVSQLRKAITIVNHLALQLDILSAMDSVRDVALELLGCEKVTLFLMFDRRKELRGRVVDSATGQSVIIRVKYGEGVAGTVAHTGETMHIRDAYGCPLFKPTFDTATSFRTRNILCCAISDQTGKKVAVLQALNKHVGHFTKADEDSLRLVGAHLGNTLAKARLHEAAKREKERLTSLHKYFKSLHSAEDLGQVIEVVVTALQEEVLHAQHVFVFLADAPRGELWTQYDVEELDEPMLARVTKGQGIVGRCAATGKPSCITEYEEDNDPAIRLLRPAIGNMRVKSLVAQPVVGTSNDKVLAVILTLNKAERANDSDIFYEEYYTQADCDALALLALEVGDCLAERMLELALAAALSVVAHNGVHASQSRQLVPQNSSSQLSSESMLRSQLMTLYFQSAPEFRNRSECGTPSSSGIWHTALHTPSLRRRSMAPVALNNPLMTSGSTSLPGSAGPGSIASSTSDALLAPRALHINVGGGLTTATSLMTSGSLGPSLGSAGSPTLLPQWSVKGPSNLRQVSLPDTPELSHMPSFEVAPVFFNQAQLSSWEFNFCSFADDDLVKLAYDIFMMSGTVDHFGLNQKVLRSFLTAVASHYHRVPYHNFNHVCHVLHSCFLILQHTHARHVLTMLEQLALLLAAVGHDLDHDGHSNSFHVNSQSELARIYNDQSVMEHHHCAMTFAILGKKDCNLLEGLDVETHRSLRKAIVAAVLCTDMANHYKLTSDFQKHPTAFDPESEAERLLLLKVILHASDIGNGVRPFSVNHEMSTRVHREFQVQTAEEVRLGLPVTFSVDPADPVMCARVEVNFLDYVVTPLWERMVEVFPELEARLRSLKDNRSVYSIVAETGDTTPIQQKLQSATSFGLLPSVLPSTSRLSSSGSGSGVGGGGLSGLLGGGGASRGLQVLAPLTEELQQQSSVFMSPPQFATSSSYVIEDPYDNNVVLSPNPVSFRISQRLSASDSAHSSFTTPTSA